MFRSRAFLKARELPIDGVTSHPEGSSGVAETNTPDRLVSEQTARRLVYGMAVLSYVVAAVLYYETFDLDKLIHVPWAIFATTVVLAFVCDQVQFTVVIRRQTLTSNLIEIPLIFAIFFMSPLIFLGIRLLVTVYDFMRATPPTPLIKKAINVGIRTIEPAVFSFIFYSLHAGEPTTARTWIIVLFAIVVANCVGASMVAGAIFLIQGPLSNSVMSQIYMSVTFSSLFNTCIALVMLITLGVNSLSAILLIIIGAIIIAGYRLYRRVSQQHATLNKVYEFTKVISTARQDGSLADSLLIRTRELLDAESASLWLPAQGRHPELLLIAREDSPGVVDDPHGEQDPLRRHVISTGQTLAVSAQKQQRNDTLQQLLVKRGDKDAIIVPLRSGGAVVGCLEVANRLGGLSAFGSEEVQLLETLAAHAAVAVENSRLVDRLSHDAYHDALTGLPNRRRLASSLEAAIAVPPAPGEVVAVMQFDVDSLRDVNETLGHEAGDRLLIEVGRRLQNEAPDGALVARLGGDEFAILVRTQDGDSAQAQALTLQYALVEPLRLDQLTLDVGAAVGIAICPDHGADAVTLMQRADVATYTAKHNPRSIQLYRPAMESRSLHRLSLVSELRRAIDDDALSVYYQPKVLLSDRELVGMECLVRWQHPEHGLVPPDDFIPVAEHTGLVGALTRSVLRTALRQCKIWQDQGRTLGVSVNLSPRSLHDPDFPEELDRMLREVGLPPQQLTLEITENAMVGDADRPLPTLHKLFTLGVRLSVDDFGTGYSSLSYLRRLPVHEVKIDKSFVLGMATDSGDLGIVRAIVDLGRHLGMSVVAEGVESEMTLTLLEEMGCDVAQGFLFSRPLPWERIEAWMQARTEAAGLSGDGPPRLRVLSS